MVQFGVICASIVPWRLTRHSHAQLGTTSSLPCQTTDVPSLEESLARAEAVCEPLRRECLKCMDEMHQALGSPASIDEMTSFARDSVCRHEMAKDSYDEARSELERIVAIFNREFWERIQ